MSGLKRGPGALGFATSLWTSERVAQLIEQTCAVRYHPGHVWRVLRDSGGTASNRQGGRSNATKTRSAGGNATAGPWKKGCGSEANDRLHRRERDWARPLSLSHLGPAWPDADPAVPLRLESALRHRRREALAVLLSVVPGHDSRAADHRVLGNTPVTPSRQTSDRLGWPRRASEQARPRVLAEQHGRISLERLPAYAPELNPAESLWGHRKHHELPNVCPADSAELSHHARRALRPMRRRPSLVEAF